MFHSKNHTHTHTSRTPGSRNAPRTAAHTQRFEEGATSLRAGSWHFRDLANSQFTLLVVVGYKLIRQYICAWCCSRFLASYQRDVLLRPRAPHFLSALLHHPEVKCKDRSAPRSISAMFVFAYDFAWLPRGRATLEKRVVDDTSATLRRWNGPFLITMPRSSREVQDFRLLLRCTYSVIGLRRMDTRSCI